MSNVAISLVKNEMEILPDFAGHILAMFDQWICIDHNSTDGTLEYLSALAQDNSNVCCVRYVTKGYFQAEVMTCVTRSHRWCRNADWVFMLDADEFLPFASKTEFTEALAKHKNNSVIRMQWMNLAPETYDDGSVNGKNYYFPKNTASHSKVAFQPKLLPLRDFTIAQGNHDIEIGRRSAPLLAQQAFPMYHIPLRSFNQLREKLVVGLAAYEARDQKQSDLGIHWSKIDELIAKTGLDESIANYVVVTYGESDFTNTYRLSQKDLLEQSKSLRVLESLITPLNINPSEDNNFENPKIELHVDKDRTPTVLGSGVKQFFEFSDEGETVSGMTSYETLSARTHSSDADGSMSEEVVRFFQPSYVAIDHLTPTAWGGHIPFMFSIVAALRPQRFVELGSHCGASFFAACQSISNNSIPGQAIAIDTWLGDHQAGYYEETVYNNFTWILNQNYPDIGRALRLEFDAAADQFEDKSIDLLHIDGLHTYEAVKHDFDTWKPKLTNDATVLFHDTNVHRDDFGVHKFWDEIKDTAHSFNFLHTHGLGVLAFGGVKANPVAHLIDTVEKGGLGEHLETHFSRLGTLSCGEAMTRIKEIEAQHKEAAAHQSRKNKKIMTKIKKVFSVRNINK